MRLQRPVLDPDLAFEAEGDSSIEFWIWTQIWISWDVLDRVEKCSLGVVNLADTFAVPKFFCERSYLFSQLLGLRRINGVDRHQRTGDIRGRHVDTGKPTNASKERLGE